MNRHTALLALPDLFTELGGNAWILDGWDTAQGQEFWTVPGEPEPDADDPAAYDGQPSCYMVHHTGTASATPVVQTPTGRWSKANAWCGLRRAGRLYATGTGVATVCFTSAGPARTSSGYGYRPMFTDYVCNDLRPPWQAEGPDTRMALNRYAFNVETVHPGDYTDLDPAVHEQLVIVGVALHLLFDWQARTISHQSWTGRKIDPRWNGDDACIGELQDAIEFVLAEPEPEGDNMVDLELWLTKIRTVDIQHMADTGIIKPGEADYFTGPTMWNPDALVGEQPIVNDSTASDWQSLYDSYRVRTPIWAV